MSPDTETTVPKESEKGTTVSINPERKEGMIASVLKKMPSMRKVNGAPRHTKKYAKRPSGNKKKMIKASKRRNR